MPERMKRTGSPEVGEHTCSTEADAQCASNAESLFISAVDALIVALEDHRLLFLFAAKCFRNSTSAWAVEQTSRERIVRECLPGWTGLAERFDGDVHVLRAGKAVLEQYAQAAVMQFGSGKGQRSQARLIDGTAIEDASGNLPYWIIDADLCPRLEASSNNILVICRGLGVIDRSDVVVHARLKAKECAHPASQHRWYGGSAIRWEYLDRVERAIAALRECDAPRNIDALPPSQEPSLGDESNGGIEVEVRRCVLLLQDLHDILTRQHTMDKSGDMAEFESNDHESLEALLHSQARLKELGLLAPKIKAFAGGRGTKCSADIQSILNHKVSLLKRAADCLLLRHELEQMLASPGGASCQQSRLQQPARARTRPRSLSIEERRNRASEVSKCIRGFRQTMPAEHITRDMIHKATDIPTGHISGTSAWKALKSEQRQIMAPPTAIHAKA